MFLINTFVLYVIDNPPDTKPCITHTNVYVTQNVLLSVLLSWRHQFAIPMTSSLIITKSHFGIIQSNALYAPFILQRTVTINNYNSGEIFRIKPRGGRVVYADSDSIDEWKL